MRRRLFAVGVANCADEKEKYTKQTRNQETTSEKEGLKKTKNKRRHRHEWSGGGCSSAAGTERGRAQFRCCPGAVSRHPVTKTSQSASQPPKRLSFEIWNLRFG